MLQKIYKSVMFNDQKKSHIRSLDGIRWFWIILVMLAHCSFIWLIPSHYINIEELWKIGVYLFFILSAYLIDRQIIYALNNWKNSLSYWSKYFSRRFLRIYPLFSLSLLVYLLMASFWILTIIDNPREVISHLFLLKWESLFWTIAVEFKYYIISPCIIIFLHYVVRWNKVITLFTIITIIYTSILLEYFYTFSNISTIKYIPTFLVWTSIAIYDFLNNKWFKKAVLWWKVHNYIFIPIFIILLIIPLLTSFFTNIDLHNSMYWIPYSMAWWISILSIRWNFFSKRFLEIHILRYLGVISFSLYLLHLPILRLVLFLDINNISKILCFFIISIIICTITFLYIEKPFMKFNLKYR